MRFLLYILYIIACLVVSTNASAFVRRNLLQNENAPAVELQAADTLPGTPQACQECREALNSPCFEECGAGGAPCVADSECFGADPYENGVCTNNMNETLVSYPVCVCYEPFAGARCNRVRKSQQTAFVLSFILGPYGADRFYLGYTNIGIGKLVLSLLLCLVPCIPICCVVCGKRDDDSPYKKGYLGPCLLFCVAYLGVIVWWLYDWILIAANTLPDADGYMLYADLGA